MAFRPAGGLEPPAMRDDAGERHRTVAATYDFPASTKPTNFYVVASTPRSGSSYLCNQLWSTGLMGAPGEYFNYQGMMLLMAARLRPNNLVEYLRRLFMLRTSANGVFGFKAQWDQFQLVINGGLLGLLHRLRFIYLERTDRLAQAAYPMRGPSRPGSGP